jgi:hypothetical protein
VQLTDKFERLATYALDADARARARANIAVLDQLPDIGPLLACLRTPGDRSARSDQ